MNGRIADAEIVTLHLPEGTQYHHKYAFLYEDDNHVTRRAFLGISATTTLPYQIGETVPLRVFRQPVLRPEADAFDPARGADGRLPGLIAFRRWLGRPVDETGTVMREEDFVPLSRELDELRHSVQNASYEQKDPLLIFKLESAKLFDNMVNEMFNRQVTILTRAQIPELQNQQVQEAAPEQHTDRQQYTENKQSAAQEEQLVDQNQRAAAQNDTRSQQPRNPIIKDKLPGRNDPCPCGSGKKFKNCHGRGLV